jgi:hypothetical protein
MKTDKELLEGFRTQFNTGHLFTESQVLVLMGYARAEARKEPRVKKLPGWGVCEACGLQNSENCNTCTLPDKVIFI